MKHAFLLSLIFILLINTKALSQNNIGATTETAKPISINQKISSLSNACHHQVDINILKLALTAYNCAVLSGQNKQSKLTVVDYSKPSEVKRLWVFDLNHDTLLFNSLVAHGKGSGENFANYFSDQPQTRASSLGLFLTGSTYRGHDGYSLKLFGLEKNFNDKAAYRNIVMHGANYVTDRLAQAGKIGRSWGCPAVPKSMAEPIIDSIKNGSVLFAYYPNNIWLQKSKYLHCSA